MSVWRLIELETCHPFMNMAIDEAIMEARSAKLASNTIRFYRWKPSAVSVGRFQDVKKEVRLSECRKIGVEIVRRMTGGGAVYHDCENELTYSVIAGTRDIGAEDAAGVYSKIYAGLAEAIKRLGVNADFSQGNEKACPNLMTSGKKISGSAQAHRRGVFLQHGTVLLEIDLRRMFTLLRVPLARSCFEVVGLARSRMTSLSAELERRVSAEETSSVLVDGFEKVLGVKLEPGTLDPHEIRLSASLCNQKYSTESWNYHGNMNQKRARA